MAAAFSAVTSYALTRTDINNAAQAQAWLAGSLNGSDWQDLTSITAVVVAGVVLAGGATAVAGPIAFVAFVAAPIARQLARSSTALLASALVGAILVTTADLLGRVAFEPSELPVGVLTGVLGAPYLLWLLTRLGSISRR